MVRNPFRKKKLTLEELAIRLNESEKKNTQTFLDVVVAEGYDPIFVIHTSGNRAGINYEDFETFKSALDFFRGVESIWKVEIYVAEGDKKLTIDERVNEKAEGVPEGYTVQQAILEAQTKPVEEIPSDSPSTSLDIDEAEKAYSSGRRKDMEELETKFMAAENEGGIRAYSINFVPRSSNKEETHYVGTLEALSEIYRDTVAAGNAAGRGMFACAYMTKNGKVKNLQQLTKRNLVLEILNKRKE